MDNSDIDSLYDSDTNTYVTADDLGISEDRYDELVQESIDAKSVEGHIEFCGRRYYAST
jgi:hypothetical protein